jgi:hypothetical protein
MGRRDHSEKETWKRLGFLGRVSGLQNSSKCLLLQRENVVGNLQKVDLRKEDLTRKQKFVHKDPKDLGSMRKKTFHLQD